MSEAVVGPGSVAVRGASGMPAAVLIVAVAATWLAWPWVSGEFTVPWDAKAHFFPQLQFLAGSLGAGQSPFWNPYIFAGWPQVADPQSLIFSPPFLILALFDPEPSFVAMDATVYALLVLGGLALLGYFHDRGWHLGGGAVAALSFAFGGAAAWRIQHTGQVISIAFLPIAMFLLARALDRRSFGWGLAAGVVAGFLALGRDQIALLGVYLLAAQAIVHLLSGPRPVARIASAVKPLAAGAVGGILVVTVPVLLTLLLAEESNRPSIDFIGAGRGSLHPASLITAVIADLFGQGDPNVHFWGPPSVTFGVTDTYLAQNMGAFYAGAIPIAAILFFGIARGCLLRREILFFTIATVITIVYAMGWYTPLFKPMFDYLPGVKLYRRPADATFILGFEIAVLGGYLVHRWLTGGIGRASGPTRAVELAIAALVLVVVPVAFGIHADRLGEAAKPTVTAMLFIAGAVAVLGVARWLEPRSSVAAVALLVAFTAFDLHWNNFPNESTAYPSEVYDALRADTKDPTIGWLKAKTRETAGGDRRDRVELTGLGFHWPNASMVHELDNVLGYNPLRFKTYQTATGAHDHVALPNQREFSAMFPSYSSIMADLLGLRYIATSVPLTTIDPKIDRDRIVEVAHFGENRIYENRGALPRVLFVDGVRSAGFDELLDSGRWPDGFDPRREVVLEAGAAERPAGGPGPAGTASIVRYGNTEVVVGVDAARSGLLVLNDVWHRWWRVEVDGRSAELLKANGIFRAVRIEAGRHEVRFSFHPFAGAWADVKSKLAGG